ncbi:MAG: hypothetical protein DMF81_11885, partial [Acidobacteria bacterium]
MGVIPIRKEEEGMKKQRTDRRGFLKSSITAAGVAWTAARPAGAAAAPEGPPVPAGPARIRFAAI